MNRVSFRYNLKTQTKIAIAFFSGILFIILLLSVLIYYFSIQYTFVDFYKRLEIRAVIEAKYNLEVEDEKASIFKELRELHLEKLPNEKDYLIEIREGINFEEKAKELNLPVSFFETANQNKSATFRQGKTFYSGIKYKHKNTYYLVIASAENYYDTHYLSYLRNVLTGIIPLITLVALAISILFSKKVFSPVKLIINKVAQINTENMHLRLETKSDNDEISELVTTFNNMLDRLETSFESQNNFISNASHELGTPLTVIIGEAEVTLNRERKAEEYQESLKVILDEAEKLKQITQSLLFLAQTGFDGKKQSMGIVRSDQLLWDVKETMDKINPKNQIYIDLSLIPDNPKKLKINGNQPLLLLAFTNIISNACKYSGNKPVKVSIGTSTHEVIIIIQDNGIGIPEAEISHIFNPFFRASNTKNYKGYGIGLSLTRNIVRLHGGRIHIFSKEGEGTTVELGFPLYFKTF